MPAHERARVSRLATHLEELWAHFDTLYDGLKPTDWSRPHGKDWTYADLLYHMTYCDRDAVTHAALAFDLGLYNPALNRALARTTALTIVFAFIDAGVGPFTLRVADGNAVASEGRANAPDLVLTQSAPHVYEDDLWPA
jgi:hypothetical protein